MKTIILSAGKSTRLLPLTKDTPQSMLKVGQKTILEIQIENLKKAGIVLDDIIIVTGYLSKKLEKFCQELGVKVLFNPFYDVSGMVASLWVAKNELKNGFLFLYADVLFDPGIIQELLKTPRDISLAIKKDDLREEAEKVFEEDGIVKNISKDKSNKENSEFIGIAKFSNNGAEKIIKELEDTLKEDINISFINTINSLIRKGEQVAVCDIKDAQFIDIDFPEDLKRAAEYFI